MTRLAWLGFNVCAGILALGVAGLVGASYAGRLNDHRGNHLVPVEACCSMRALSPP